MTTNIMPADDSRGLGLPMPPEWFDQAVCASADPEAYFPEKGGRSSVAKRICQSSCPVQAECLEYALANHIRYGIWGGASERERRAMERGAA